MERAPRQLSGAFVNIVWGVLHAEIRSSLVDTYFEVEFYTKHMYFVIIIFS